MSLLEYNEFDSETFGLEIFNRTIDDINELDPYDSVSKYDLLVIESKSMYNGDNPNFKFVGSMQILRGTFDKYYSNVSKISSRGDYSTIKKSDWSFVEDLYNFSSSTRFSNESKFSKKQVRSHKLKMLRKYSELYPFYSIIHSSNGKINGFHSAIYDLERKLFIPYELIVAPEFRNGFIALNLLRENAEHFDNEFDSSEFNVETKIYSDNNISLNLFRKLGLETVDEKYYYNIWKI